MKTVKISKKDLKDTDKLLKKCGVVFENNAFPWRVFVSKNDYKTLQKNVRAAFKKEYPYLRGKKLESSVGMHMLNLAPSQQLEDAVKEGFVLVDDSGVQRDIEAVQKTQQELGCPDLLDPIPEHDAPKVAQAIGGFVEGPTKVQTEVEESFWVRLFKR